MAKAKKKTTQAIQTKMPLIIIVAACLTLGGIIAFQAIKDRGVERFYTLTTWSKESAEGFFDTCIYTAQRPGSGVSDHAAKVYCGCDIDELQKLYKSDDDLNEAGKNWVKDGYPENVVAAFHTCGEKAKIPVNI